MKVKSLSEYIQKLQGASEILKRKKSFSDWLIEKKVDPDGDYKRGLLASDKKRSEAAPGYGKLGDNLHRSGLAVSGYADHLLAEKRLEAKAKKDSTNIVYYFNIECSGNKFCVGLICRWSVHIGDREESLLLKCVTYFLRLSDTMNTLSEMLWSRLSDLVKM